MMEVEMKIRGLMMDPVTNMPIVILKDVNGNTVLPIWVGIYEANAIALEIEKVSTPRPMSARWWLVSCGKTPFML
jgi:bifunctional DNase/RNase